MFLASKIFEVKKKGVRDDILASNICLRTFGELGQVKSDCRSVRSVEARTYGKATDS